MQINYQPIGSGGGIKQITEGTVDFGASDGPMNDAADREFKTSGARTSCISRRFWARPFRPTTSPACQPADLNFTGEALAGIFLGKITKWNDPELAKANPGVNFRTPISS